jgi:hypothetical protein
MPKAPKSTLGLEAPVAEPVGFSSPDSLVSGKVGFQPPVAKPATSSLKISPFRGLRGNPKVVIPEGLNTFVEKGQEDRVATNQKSFIRRTASKVRIGAVNFVKDKAKEFKENPIRTTVGVVALGLSAAGLFFPPCIVAGAVLGAVTGIYDTVQTIRVAKKQWGSMTRGEKAKTIALVSLKTVCSAAALVIGVSAVGGLMTSVLNTTAKVVETIDNVASKAETAIETTSQVVTIVSRTEIGKKAIDTATRLAHRAGVAYAPGANIVGAVSVFGLNAVQNTNPKFLRDHKKKLKEIEREAKRRLKEQQKIQKKEGHFAKKEANKRKAQDRDQSR